MRTVIICPELELPHNLQMQPLEQDANLAYGWRHMPLSQILSERTQVPKAIFDVVVESAEIIWFALLQQDEDRHIYQGRQGSKPKSLAVVVVVCG